MNNFWEQLMPVFNGERLNTRGSEVASDLLRSQLSIETDAGNVGKRKRFVGSLYISSISSQYHLLPNAYIDSSNISLFHTIAITTSDRANLVGLKPRESMILMSAVSTTYTPAHYYPTLNRGREQV